eukprot:5129662-Pleurochrysis_carterae.AAC.1
MGEERSDLLLRQVEPAHSAAFLELAQVERAAAVAVANLAGKINLRWDVRALLRVLLKSGMIRGPAFMLENSVEGVLR